MPLSQINTSSRQHLLVVGFGGSHSWFPFDIRFRVRVPDVLCIGPRLHSYRTYPKHSEDVIKGFHGHLIYGIFAQVIYFYTL